MHCFTGQWAPAVIRRDEYGMPDQQAPANKQQCRKRGGTLPWEAAVAIGETRLLAQQGDKSREVIASLKLFDNVPVDSQTEPGQ